METRRNVTTTRRDYPVNSIHKTRDTYVLMATVSIILLVFAFLMAFLHRKCRNSIINLKNWIAGNAPSERGTSKDRLGNRKQTTSGKVKLRLDHPSSPVYSKDVYASPTYYLCKEDNILKMKQSISKDRKGSLKTMHTIQEDAEDDSGISIISSPTPKPNFSFDPSILQAEYYKNTPITVEHDGCLIRVLAPESFTSSDYRKCSITSSGTDPDKAIHMDGYISSRHSSIISFPQNEEFMRRNSSFSSDCGFTHIDFEDCQCYPQTRHTDNISIGTSKCLSEGGSHTSLSNISGEYYLREKHSSFDSLTSNEILMAIGTCKRHSLKPKLESKNSFDSVSLDTTMGIYDHDSYAHAHAGEKFETDDHSLLCESCELDQYINSKINKRLLSKKHVMYDDNDNAYENFAFEHDEDKVFHFDQGYDDRQMHTTRYGQGTNSFEALEVNTKPKLHRLGRSNTFPNRNREEVFPCSSKFEHLPDIAV